MKPASPSPLERHIRWDTGSTSSPTPNLNETDSLTQPVFTSLRTTRRGYFQCGVLEVTPSYSVGDVSGDTATAARISRKRG